MSEEREWLAAQALMLVDTKNFSPRRAIDSIPFLGKQNTPLRATIQALVFETIRRENIIDRMANNSIQKFFSQKNSEIPSLKKLKPILKNLLRIFIYRLKFEKHPLNFILNTGNMILINKGFNNQIENFRIWLVDIDLLDEKDFIANLTDPVERLALNTWHPYFFTKRMIEVYQEDATLILNYFSTNAPVYVRFNFLKDTSIAIEELDKNNVQYEKDFYMADVYKILRTKIPIARFNAIENGYFYIQSRSSALVSHLLEPKENELILDACAAPGSKTTHIASLTNDKAKIIAIELDEHRILTLKKTLERMDVRSVQVIHADASDQNLKLPTDFDKILLDAPCSGSGILANKPHGKWRIKSPLIKKYSNLQKELISNLSKFLKVNGILLYSTCSLLPEENEEVIKYFLDKNNNFESIPMKYKDLGKDLEYFGKRLLPNEIDSEGFSIFMLKKISI